MKGLLRPSELAPDRRMTLMSIPDHQWTRRETELLNAAVEKIVRVGEEVGLTPEDIIAFLESGCSVRDLLVMLAAKRSGAA
jgi:hypothetical protein